MIRITTLLSLILIPTLVAFSQGKIMFTKQVLDNPIEYSQWFDRNLELVYVDAFEAQNFTQTTCLENGYVKHQFLDGNNLRDSHWGATPVSIDVVYTKYPFYRDDWQTNYFTLLANRLKELFLLDSTLNSTSIKWRLVMQTNGKSGNEAKHLFHGIVINYSPQFFAYLPVITPQFRLNPPQVETETISVFMDYADELVVNEPNLEAILYPKTVYNRDMKQRIPERVKQYKEPGCSKFSTRADRPKVGLWARLFR
ncbi:MAG: hypothetical protein RBR40_07440 [Tenuifilaceae bacterium]|nr:hypothetical protein [Tenuifilaceae bacterium]